MNKVYLIGVGVGEEHIAAARASLSIAANIPMICVSKVEEIPIEDRIQQISEMRSLKAPPLLEIPNLIDFERPKKRKGHERQYKFHR